VEPGLCDIVGYVGGAGVGDGGSLDFEFVLKNLSAVLLVQLLDPLPGDVVGLVL